MKPNYIQKAYIKGKYPDAVAMFRVSPGWYEVYGNDATKVATLPIVKSHPDWCAIYANVVRIKADKADDLLPSIVRAGYRCAMIEDLNLIPKSLFGYLWRAIKAFFRNK